MQQKILTNPVKLTINHKNNWDEILLKQEKSSDASLPFIIQSAEIYVTDDEGGDSVATEKEGVIGGGGASLSSASPLPQTATASVIAQDLITEHIVKSPPEPTRVKSPEQILMRSPDPVNWTVPLDTGKTFTVTQNVREGKCHSIMHFSSHMYRADLGV